MKPWNEIAAAAQSLSQAIQSTGKGKGKNKGSGKGEGGKGKSNLVHKAPTSLKAGQWLCHYILCPSAEQAKPNGPMQKRCMGCGVLKSEAMNPPKGQRVDHRGSPSTSLKETQAAAKAEEFKARAAEATTRKTAGVQSSQTSNGGTGASDKAAATKQKEGQEEVEQSLTLSTAAQLVRAADQLLAPEKPTRKALSFTDEHREAFKLLLPALQPIISSLAADYIPAPLELDKADEVAQKWLGESRPCNRAREKQELQEKAERLKATIAQLNEDEAELLRPSLASTEAALQKLSKEPSDVASQLAGVKEAISRYQRNVQERKQRQEMAKARTTARVNERKGMVAALTRAIQEASKAMTELEKQHTDAHAARSLAHVRQDEAVLNKLNEEQQKLQAVIDAEEAKATAAADARPANPFNHLPLGGAGAAGQQQAQQQDPAAGLAALQKQLEDAQKNMKAQLEETQKQHMAQLQLLKDALERKDQVIQQRNQLAHREKQIYEAHLKEVDGVALDAMPILQVPAGEQLTKQGQLFALLQSWSDKGAETPVTFQNLVDHSELKADAPMFLRTILGSAFRKWFPEEPGAESVIPKQALLLALQSLDRLRQTWQSMESSQEISRAAAGSFAQVEGEAKKRRAELMDAVM